MVFDDVFVLAVHWTLPACLLVTVAASQVALTRTAALTPWKGGGFGMFSTLDHGAFRRVSVIVDGPERSETVDIPPSLEVLAARVANCPADWLVLRLAREIVDRERRYGRRVDRVSVDVWSTTFSPATLHATDLRRRSFMYDTLQARLLPNRRPDLASSDGDRTAAAADW